MAKAAVIYLTGLDLTRLENAVDRVGNNSPLADLVNDLTIRANVMPGNKTPADMVTMNSVVCVVGSTDAEQEWTLVYPEEASVASAKPSTPSPMGAALLDAYVGKSVKYSAPNDTRRSLRIDRMAFQPEAVDQHTLQTGCVLSRRAVPDAQL